MVENEPIEEDLEQEDENEPVVTTESEVTITPIPFETTERDNPELPIGETRVVQTGVDGELETTTEITYEDGIEVSRQVISEEIITEPVNEIIENGTMEEIEEPPQEEIPEELEDENNNQNNRRNKKMKYGLKEVADVIFFDIVTNRPVLVFDTLKVSNIENASESAEATGGKGNAQLISWDYGRTATLTMQDALLSDESLAMLAGNEVRTGVESGATITRYEVVIAGEDGAITPTHAVGDGPVVAYSNEGGVLGAELEVEGSGEAMTTDALAGSQVALFYESPATEETSIVTFQSDKFPAIYRVVGTTLVRDTDGIDHAYQFKIPRAKLQAGFTFTMDPENVSTFDFNLTILVDQSNKKLYDIVRM